MADDSNHDEQKTISMIKDRRTLSQRKQDAETRKSLNDFCHGLRASEILGGDHCLAAEYRRNRAKYLKNNQQKGDTS
jgi:hypothetical protein